MLKITSLCNDAQELYSRVGFKQFPYPERVMCFSNSKTFKKFVFFTLVLFCKPIFAAMPHSVCATICSNRLGDGKECIRLDNKQIYVHKAGQGSPTVIFSSGTGMPADNWFDSGIAGEIAKKTTVLTYDRLYTFNSCQNVNDFMPVTAASVTEDLHKLLALLKLPPPYILVGHSMGGLYMLYYASRYPQEVAGILLLDASSAEGPTPLPKEALPILNRRGNPQNPSSDNFLYNEMIGQLPSYLQMQQASSLPKNIPVIVLSAGRHCLPLAWTKKLMCMTPQQERDHQRQQKDLSASSSSSRYQLVQGDHNVFFTSKGTPIVIDAIYRLLK